MTLNLPPLGLPKPGIASHAVTIVNISFPDLLNQQLSLLLHLQQVTHLSLHGLPPKQCLPSLPTYLTAASVLDSSSPNSIITTPSSI